MVDMKFREIIRQTEWEDIQKSLLNSYSDTSENIGCYKELYTILVKLNPLNTNFRICISEEFNKEFDDEPYTSVIGKNGTLNKELPDFKYMKQDDNSKFANSEVNYSIALTDWKEWLGMTLDEVSLQNYTYPNIVAHCFLEITFYGFDQETIKKQEEEFNRRVKEVKNMTEEEKKQNLIPWERIVEEIDK